MRCIGWKIKSCESTIPLYFLHVISCSTYKYKVWEEFGMVVIVTCPYHSPAPHNIAWAIGSFHNDCKER